MPAVGTIRGQRIWPRRPEVSASAASGKTSVISTSLRRGAASVAAPTRVTRTIGVASATSSHQRRRSPSSDEAGEPEGDEQRSGRRGRGCCSSLRRPRCSTSGRPCARSSPGSRAGLRRSTWRSSPCRSCRAPSRGAGRGSVLSATWSKSGVGSTSFSASECGGSAAPGLALVEDRLDPLVFAVGGEEGADVERLAAAGRDRHQAAEDVGVADRPGEDHGDQRGGQQRRAGEAGAPAATQRRRGARRGRRRRRRPAGTRAGTSPSARTGARAPARPTRRARPRSPRGRRAPPPAG